MEKSKGFNLYGTDFFGEAINPPSKGTMSDHFILPPFSVLNAREGVWQSRKRRWLSLGIKSEVGRGEDSATGGSPELLARYNAGMKSTWDPKRKIDSSPDGSPRPACDYSKRERGNGAGKPMANSAINSIFGRSKNAGDNQSQTGTSIFDPVLCELMYKWLCPKQGQIVDPFAGGSVRGIVAHMLDYKYWGCDLSEVQIDANYEQAEKICGISKKFIKVKISVKSLQQLFTPCLPEYIKKKCHGRCCQGTNEIKVTIHKSEEKRIKELGGEIDNGFLVADKRGLCPFKADNGLCRIHNEKPFGCAASPFTLNKNNTLIVRNRYRLLKCYKEKEGKVPVWEAHKQSLINIFGKDETDNIIKEVINNNKYQASLSFLKYQMLIDNDFVKNQTEANDIKQDLQWITGDAIDEIENAPKADFIFSCPPYGDLEKYSNDKRDLSNMEYHTFIAAMKRIILRCYKRLNNNRFACFVVGDFRDKKGFYRNFISDTISCFIDNNFKLYNEAILVTVTGSLPIRVTKQFNASRKMGKTHQNILIFVKGNPKIATKEIIGE